MGMIVHIKRPYLDGTENSKGEISIWSTLRSLEGHERLLRGKIWIYG